MRREEEGRAGENDREIAKTRTEDKVWEMVNRGRKIRKRVRKGITQKEWKDYFMGLLGGRERRGRGVQEEVRESI